MSQEKKINVEFAQGEAVKTLILREGPAEVLREEKGLTINGNLSAPATFWKNRSTLHGKHLCHIIVNRQEMTLKLITEERDYLFNEIKGKLETNPELKEFGINKEKQFTIKELAQFLKMRRFFFADADENLKLVTNLNKFKASVQSQIDQQSDTRGNKVDNFEVKVDSNIDLKFVLNIPIYKGTDKKKFQVEICFDVREKSVSVWLESAELRELELSMRDSLIDAELKNFEGLVIIEQ